MPVQSCHMLNTQAPHLAKGLNIFGVLQTKVYRGSTVMPSLSLLSDSYPSALGCWHALLLQPKQVLHTANRFVPSLKHSCAPLLCHPQADRFQSRELLSFLAFPSCFLCVDTECQLLGMGENQLHLLRAAAEAALLQPCSLDPSGLEAL